MLGGIRCISCKKTAPWEHHSCPTLGQHQANYLRLALVWYWPNNAWAHHAGQSERPVTSLNHWSDAGPMLDSQPNSHHNCTTVTQHQIKDLGLALAECWANDEQLCWPHENHNYLEMGNCPMVLNPIVMHYDPNRDRIFKFKPAVALQLVTGNRLYVTTPFMHVSWKYMGELHWFIVQAHVPLVGEYIHKNPMKSEIYFTYSAKWNISVHPHRCMNWHRHTNARTQTESQDSTNNH